MAGSKKISDLNAIVTIDVADILPIVDTDAVETKYITVQQLDDRYLNAGTDFNVAWDARLALKDSDNLTEGSTNKYYTEARVIANAQVAANSAARHDELTIGTPNGLSLDAFSQNIHLALSGTSSTGSLSDTDWNTFNNKQNALSNANTTTDGILTSTDWNTFNDKLDGSTYDGLETEFTGVANNQSIPAPVTGLQFNANARMGFLMISAEINATAPQYTGKLFLATNQGGTWVLTAVHENGDLGAATFSIGAGGQVEYTTPSFPGFSSGKIKHRFFTLTI